MGSRAEDFLGQEIDVIVDRPVGSQHPRHGWRYPINYGFVPDTRSGDGEELDVYVLGVAEPLQNFHGRVIACLRRLEEDDDKLIAIPLDADPTLFTDEVIGNATSFQEQFFRHKLLR